MCTLYGICVRMCRSGLPVFVCYVLCVCICMYARTRLYMLLFAYLTVCSPNIYTCHVVYAPMALDVSVWFIADVTGAGIGVVTVYKFLRNASAFLAAGTGHTGRRPPDWRRRNRPGDPALGQALRRLRRRRGRAGAGLIFLVTIFLKPCSFPRDDKF